LYLRFQSGEIYCYFDVLPEEYRNFLAADSKGKYFASHIRDRYRFERLRYRKHGST
jgi:isocitrate dehydrogenase kinase/phosphatase